ncbi:MAG: Flp pilus assembly protein CpaB [Candidatus Omnitrophota bacterium]|nr:Flp pilus assembly protein CpaB [Candidatus Omnitrophota bacterium]
MNRSLVLVIAGVSGLLAFVISLRLVNTPKYTVQDDVVVVSAIRDIDVGAIIKSSDIDLLPAKGALNLKVHYRNAQDVVGKLTRRHILKGEYVKSTDILADGDNLAALIPSGYRALTIPVNLPANLVDMLRIGNRVDVLLTYELRPGEINSITLVENVRVISVSKPSDRDAAGGMRQMHITVAVVPAGVETLTYAMKKGSLNVAVRPLTDDEQERFFTLKELFSKDVKVEDLLDQGPRFPMNEIEIIKGVRKEKFQYS